MDDNFDTLKDLDYCPNQLTGSLLSNYLPNSRDLINDLNDKGSIKWGSTISKSFIPNDHDSYFEKDMNLKSNNIDAAMQVGKKVAERALENGVKKVVFDRSGYRYHGRIKALADSAREAGLEF